jgi:hypothetical protein
MPLPVYLKTDAEMPRPGDPEFYWLTRSGAFLCRNHPFFTSDVPAKRGVKALAEHEAALVLRYPLVKASMLETIVGFFSRVYELHRSESVVLLYWDLKERRYRVCVPEQEATVGTGWGGRRYPQDVRYQTPIPPPGCLLAGDIHCHGNMAAYSSYTDRADEVYRDGFHAIVGRIDDEPPEFHVEFAIDGGRFEMQAGQIFEGYQKRRGFVPRQWLEQVQVKVEQPYSWSWRDDSWKV